MNACHFASRSCEMCRRQMHERRKVGPSSSRLKGRRLSSLVAQAASGSALRPKASAIAGLSCPLTGRRADLGARVHTGDQSSSETLDRGHVRWQDEATIRHVLESTPEALCDVHILAIAPDGPSVSPHGSRGAQSGTVCLETNLNGNASLHSA